MRSLVIWGHSWNLTKISNPCYYNFLLGFFNCKPIKTEFLVGYCSFQIYLFQILHQLKAGLHHSLNKPMSNFTFWEKVLLDVLNKLWKLNQFNLFTALIRFLFYATWVRGVYRNVSSKVQINLVTIVSRIGGGDR